MTVWLHGALALLQQSSARQVRVAISGQMLLVTVFWTRILRLVPQQLSVAVGEPNVHGVLGDTVMLLGQVSVGGVVSTTATNCVQIALLLQQSVTCHAPAQRFEQALPETRLLLSN